MFDSASSHRLGLYFLAVDSPTESQRQGLDLLRHAADTADDSFLDGAYTYGMMLAGESIPNLVSPIDAIDFEIGREYLEKAAFLGSSKAQLEMGLVYERCKLGCDFDPALAMHYCLLAARQGEAEADMAISKWFLSGYGELVEQKEELAFAFARRAAETNLAHAEFAVGCFYEIGMYVLVDLDKAMTWYERASEHGSSEALGSIEAITNAFKKGKGLQSTKLTKTSSTLPNLSLLESPDSSERLTSGTRATYGFKVRAIYNFVPFETGELEFQKGDIITVLLKVRKYDWYKGILRGKIGLFPTNYVEILVENVSNKAEEPNTFESF